MKNAPFMTFDGLDPSLWLDALISALKSGPKAQKQFGAGQIRARRRLAEKRRRNMEIPTIEREPTRQQRRRHAILLCKQAMTIAKKDMAQGWMEDDPRYPGKQRRVKPLGGAAVVRGWRQFIPMILDREAAA